MRKAWVVLALAAGAVDAHAADCASSYAVDHLLGDLVAVESALRASDNPAAGTAATKLETGLACMTEVLPRMIAGRAYRAIGGGLVANGKAPQGEDWLRVAAEIEQSFEFGLEDLPAEHPVRGIYADARSSSSGEEKAVEGKSLVAGTVYIDGRKLTEPKARDDRFHVVQLSDESGVRSWVIIGNAFPADVLTTATVVAAVADAEDAGKAAKVKPPKPPKAEKTPEPEPEPEPEPAVAAADPEPGSGKPPKAAKPAPTDAGGSSVVQRERPWEKTPLIIGGATIIGGAGAVYYASFAKRKQFNESNSVAEITELQPRVNQLFVASYAVLAVGAGTLTWGVILEGGAPIPSIRFRF